MFRRFAVGAFCIGMSAFGTTAALAASDPPAPQKQFNSNAIWFENWDGLSNAMMRVFFPDGRFETIESRSGTPVFKLKGSDIPDGIYYFELSAATDQTVPIVNQLDNGRGSAQRTEQAVPFNMTGQFVVQRGVIVLPEDIKEE